MGRHWGPGGRGACGVYTSNRDSDARPERAGRLASDSARLGIPGDAQIRRPGAALATGTGSFKSCVRTHGLFWVITPTVRLESGWRCLAPYPATIPRHSARGVVTTVGPVHSTTRSG